jgi:transcription termination factor NusB
MKKVTDVVEEGQNQAISEREMELLNAKDVMHDALDKMLDKKSKLEANISAYVAGLESIEKELSEIQG